VIWHPWPTDRWRSAPFSGSRCRPRRSGSAR
jgi:hypothetical protein